MSSTDMPSAPFVGAQTEPSNTAVPSGTGVSGNTSRVGSENSSTEEVNEPEMAYKMIARRQLHKSEMKFLLKVLPRYELWTTSIVANIEKHQLIEATSYIDDKTVIVAENPDERELEIIKTKQSVRYTQIITREEWVKDFGPDGHGNWPPWVKTPGSSDESLWKKMDLSNDMMRRIRNKFAHNYQPAGEIEDFQWMYGTFTVVIPALKVLIKKLKEALDDPEHWTEYKPYEHSVPAEDLTGIGIPEYAKDTPETEALWAAEFEEYEQQMRAIIEAEMEDSNGTWELEEEAEPAAEGEGNDGTQNEDSGKNAGNQPSESHGCMDFALRKSMEFAFKAKAIRRVANAFGQKLREMQGDLDPREWIATGIHYHQAFDPAPEQAPEWIDIPDEGSAWNNSVNPPAAEGENPSATIAAGAE